MIGESKWDLLGRVPEPSLFLSPFSTQAPGDLRRGAGPLLMVPRVGPGLA